MCIWTCIYICCMFLHTHSWNTYPPTFAYASTGSYVVHGLQHAFIHLFWFTHMQLYTARRLRPNASSEGRVWSRGYVLYAWCCLYFAHCHLWTNMCATKSKNVKLYVLVSWKPTCPHAHTDTCTYMDTHTHTHSWSFICCQIDAHCKQNTTISSTSSIGVVIYHQIFWW